MKFILTIAVLSLSFGSAAQAFEPATEAFIVQHKKGKQVAHADLASLMVESERWCYLEEAGSCSWSDIYLEVDAVRAQYEVSNAWSESVDIAFVDYGTFMDGDMLCETGMEWLASVRAVQRADGQRIGGRALYDLKAEIVRDVPDDGIDCFDYLYMGADVAAQTVTLRQRQWQEGVHIADYDTEVTLHFNAADAAALTLRW